MDDIIRDSDADIVMFMYNSTDFKSMIDVIKDQRESFKVHSLQRI